jgi:hypothetical protein
MYRVQTFHGLHFDDESAIDQEIDSQVIADALSPVFDRNPSIAFHMKVVGHQFDGEAIAIDRFEKPGTQCRMNRYGMPDDSFCESIDIVDRHAGDTSMHRAEGIR